MKRGYESAPDSVPEIEATIVSGYFDKAEALGSKDNTKENNASSVVRLEFGDVSFLFMGDAEGKDRAQDPETSRYVEKLLVEKQKKGQLEVRSTVLKVGHHGSETSSTHDFMDAVSPDVLVVMSGRKKFGKVFLPDDTVLDRYEDRIPGITIVRTDRDDTKRSTINDADGDHVYMYTDGDTLRVYEARKIAGKWKWVLKASVQPDNDDDPS
jgi:beta-lactamase superfamily II metal-dependent hydrolase